MEDKNNSLDGSRDLSEINLEESSLNNVGLQDGELQMISLGGYDFERDQTDHLNLDDDIFNYLNEYADINYFEEFSEDDFETMDDVNVVEGAEESTSVQVQLSDLENEYVDMLSEVTFSENKDKNLFEAHKEIICILNKMKGKDPEENNDENTKENEKINRNESNSTVESFRKTILRNDQQYYMNYMEMDCVLYYLVSILEKHEIAYFQTQILNNRKQSVMRGSILKYFYNKLLKYKNSDLVFKDNKPQLVYKLRLIKTANIKYPTIYNLQNPLLERITFQQTLDDYVILCHESSLFSLDDYVNHLFKFDTQCLVKDKFYKSSNVLKLVEKIFQNTFPDISYFEQSRRISFSVILGLTFLHSKNILHNNLSTKTIGMSSNGVVKIGGFYYDQIDWETNVIGNNPEIKIKLENIETVKEHKRIISFSSDYYMLSKVINGVFIPALDLLSFNQIPPQVLNMLLERNFDLSLTNLEKHWDLYILYHRKLNDFLRILFADIGNEDLGQFLYSFCLPENTRCCNFTTPIVIRQFQTEYKENILSLDIIRKMPFYFDLNDQFSSLTSFVSNHACNIMKERLCLVSEIQDL